MMGRCKNYNTVAPETRHKETKMDAHKTNNQASVGSSILRCNLDAEADRRLTWLEEVCAQFIIIMLKLNTKAHKSQDCKNILST